jgi:phosphonate transport system ATP-binding protein
MNRPPHVVIEGLRCEAPDGRVTLDIARLQIGAGERLAIVGPNGAGKSTLLRCLSGFATPVAGRVQVLDRVVGARMAGPELRRLRGEVAQVLQGLHLVQRLTVLENVLIGALGRLHGWRSWARWHRPQDVAEALRAIDAVGLTAKADERTDRLSGGERQKASIARMLMQRPRLILADEPTASLDPAAAREVCRLLQGGAAQATLITVVHHPELLPLLADRVIGLRHGRLMFDQPLARLDPAVLDALYGADTDSTAQSVSPTPLSGRSFRPFDMTAVLPGLLQ